YLVELYKEIYNHKDFLKLDFKYSISEVEDFYNQTNISSKVEKSSKKETIRDDILNLKTADDVKEYLSKYIANANQSKEDLLKNISLSEFAYLYKIIYSSQLKPNMRKIDAFRTIEKYFNGISRAVSMKP
ncbi:MAG: hypothetical protein LBB77_03820, partial [Treponema sp.]|nr:hypothetical protein [Treponema sp.]